MTAKMGERAIKTPPVVFNLRTLDGRTTWDMSLSDLDFFDAAAYARRWAVVPVLQWTRQRSETIRELLTVIGNRASSGVVGLCIDTTSCSTQADWRDLINLTSCGPCYVQVPQACMRLNYRLADGFFARDLFDECSATISFVRDSQPAAENREGVLGFLEYIEQTGAQKTGVFMVQRQLAPESNALLVEAAIGRRLFLGLDFLHETEVDARLAQSAGVDNTIALRRYDERVTLGDSGRNPEVQPNIWDQVARTGQVGLLASLRGCGFTEAEICTMLSVNAFRALDQRYRS